jgi:hypothetical protein
LVVSCDKSDCEKWGDHESLSDVEFCGFVMGNRSDTFHLVDLVSQAVAVQSLLRGRSAEEKIQWLSAHGSIEPLPKTQPDWPQLYWFYSLVTPACCFFLDGDEIVFMGDQTTFTASDSKEQ